MKLANGWNEFYSRTFGNGENIEVFLDEDLEPTTSYPHIHVVHHGNGNVDVVASVSSGNQVFRKTLYGADGNQVNAVLKEAAVKLAMS